MVAGNCEKGSENGSPSRLLGVAWLNGILFFKVGSWAVLGVVEIIIGGLYIDKCPREDMLPVWLIVDAFIPVFFVIGFVLHLKEGSTDDLKRYGSVFLVMAIILSLGWTICGAVWIYSNRSEDGCDTVVDSFAFAMITFYWATMWMWCNICVRLLARHCYRPRISS